MYPLKHHVVPYPKSVEYPAKLKNVFSKPFKQNVYPDVISVVSTDTFYAKKKKKKSNVKDKDDRLD
jgi:hypothetical protein